MNTEGQVIAGRPCLAGDCSCDAIEGEDVCAFHLDAYEVTRRSIPLTDEGKWDGFGSVRPKLRRRDERGERRDDLMRAMTPPTEASAGYANRRSRFAEIVEALIRAPKGIAIPVPPDINEKKYMNGLRCHLKQSKKTMHGRWSVRLEGDQIFVRRIGSFANEVAA